MEKSVIDFFFKQAEIGNWDQFSIDDVVKKLKLDETEFKKKIPSKLDFLRKYNALVDRENASMLFTDAWQQMKGGAIEHATLGPTMSKYLERMNKSNEQILRLAELIAKAEEDELLLIVKVIINSLS